MEVKKMKGWKKSLMISIILILISSSLHGSRNISRSQAGSGAPAVAVNKDGVVLVVWVEDVNKDENAGTLFYSVYKNNEWTDPRNLGITLYLAWTPQLDVDAQGNFHLAYADGASRLNREVYHCVYNPQSGWGKSSMIWLSPENSAWHKIDVEEDRVYIVWFHEHAGIYEGSDIVMQSKRIDDSSWPSLYERLSYTAQALSIHPAFKVKNNIVHAVWMEGSPLHAPWRLFYKEAERGSNWMTVPHVEISSLGYYPELEIDDKGNIHVVYSNRTGNFFYRKKVAQGGWKPVEIISNRYAPLQFGDIRYNNNVLVAVWVQTELQGTSVYYSKKSVDGKWDIPTQIEQGHDAFLPKLWLDDNGYAHFVWKDRGEIFYEKISIPIPDPFLRINPESLSFTVEGENPEPGTLSVKNIGEKPLSYRVQVDQTWLNVAPGSGRLEKDEEDVLQCTVDAIELDEGTYTGRIEVSSTQAINSPQYVNVTLEVLAPPIYPPLNFKGELLENKALFFREYLHHLSWEPNPLNRDIEHYRLYEIDGVNRILLEEFSSSTFEFTRRNIDPSKTYTYELWAVDKKGRMSNEPATLEMSGSLSVTLSKEKSSSSGSQKGN